MEVLSLVMHNAVKRYGGVEMDGISSSSKLSHRSRCGQLHIPLPYARSHGIGWMGHRTDGENKINSANQIWYHSNCTDIQQKQIKRKFYDVYGFNNPHTQTRQEVMFQLVPEMLLLKFGVNCFVVYPV